MNKYFIEYMDKIKSNIYLMKNLTDIKKEFGITSKKDIIDTFGLPANTTTKQANKFLKEQYKITLSQIKEDDRRFRAKQKQQQKRKIDKIKNNITKFKQNRIDSVDFNKLNPAEMKALLQSLQNVSGRILFSAGNRTFTLTPDRINELLNNIDNMFMNVEEATGSDEEYIITSITNELPVNISRPPTKEGKSSNNGSFFKYYHKMWDIEPVLEHFGIYWQKPKQYKENCFIQALIASGLDEDTIRDIRNMITPDKGGKMSNKYIQTKDISKIGNKFELQFKIKKPEVHNDMFRGKMGGKVIHLGLIDNHYFHIQEVPITMYAVEHYEELKDLDRFNEIYSKNGKKTYRDKKRFTNSYTLIKYMYDNKDKYLEQIPYEDIIDTQYHHEAVLDKLEYATRNIQHNRTKQPPKYNNYNVFYDFETSTEDKHIPYIVCAKTEDGIKKTFYGEDCGKKLLNWLLYNVDVKLDNDTRIKLIAHNAGYDIRFLQKYIVPMKMIERGHSIMNMLATYGKMKFEVQDSLSIITMALKKFGDTFGLPVSKEILPYNMYSLENIDRRYIPVANTYKYCEIQVNQDNTDKKVDDDMVNKYYKDFIDNATKWNCIKYDKIDIIEYSKIYCEMDVEVLEQGWNKFNDMLKELNIDVNDYISSAQLANDYMTIQGVYDDVLKVNSTPRQYMTRAVVGGRVMCANNKKVIRTGRLQDFDAVSLYPSAMERLGGYLKGRPKVLEQHQLNKEFLDTCDGYVIQIKITKVNKHRTFPCITYQDNKGNRCWSNEPTCNMYVGKIQFEDIIKYHEIEYNIIDGYYYDEGRNYILKDSITKIFNERLKAKAEGNKIQEVYKLIMNSAYGKTILKAHDEELVFKNQNNIEPFIDKNYNMIKYYEKIESNEDYQKYKIKMEKGIMEHYNNVICGVEVLEMSKRIMNEVMYLAEDMDIPIYYQDTDSMHLDEENIDKLAKMYKLVYGKDLIGKGMGQFHSDFDSKIIKKGICAVESIFLGKKCYIDKLEGYDKDGNKVNDYHIRMKGVPNKSILYKSNIENRDVMEIYRNMYNGNPEEFDLNCGGHKINFEYNNDMTISTRTTSYIRTIKF